MEKYRYSCKTMARARVTPTSEERSFGIDELFFSTTDAHGIIVSGNRVFTRVSAWSADELTGEPHSILRHPDMPRVVFKLLWDEIGAGRPVVAYVKNLAKNGAYYWVIASVVPFEGGYLSVRFKPSSALFPTVEGLYAQLLKVEKDVEDSGGSKAQAMAASGAALGQALASLGFATYQDFMHAFVPEELKSRDEGMARMGKAVAAVVVERPDEFGEIGRDIAAVRSFLHEEFSQLGDFISLGDTLVGKARFIQDLAKNVRLISQNVSISARRRELAGRPLAVVGDTIREQADRVGEVTSSLTTRIHGLSASLKAQAFRISLSRLQAQTASAFVAEIVDEREGANVADRHIGHVYESIGALAQCLSVDTRGLFDDYRVIARGLSQTTSEVMQLGDLTRTLNMIRMTGRVEVSRLKDPIEFEVLFESIEKQLAEADGHLRELISAINSIKTSTTRGLGQEGMVRGRLERAADAVQRIKAAELAEPVTPPGGPASE